MRRDTERRHLPLLDEGIAREDCLQPNIAAPNLVIVKDFIYFYIATSRSKLINKPTINSINIVVE